MSISSDHIASRNGDCAKIQNVVATFQLGRVIGLVPLSIALSGRSAPTVFPAMVSRSTDTATANSVFGTGRTVMVGCRTEAHALMGAQMMVWLIYKKTGIVCSVFNFNVCNVVARVEVPYSIPPPATKDEPLPPEGGINMTMLFSDIKLHPSTAADKGFKWDQDKFPGLKWKVELPGFPNEFCTFAWFVRGRGVATGLRDPSRLAACNKIINDMPSYERGSEYRDMTAEEKERDAESAIVAAAKAPSKKKRKREQALAQQQQQQQQASV